MSTKKIAELDPEVIPAAPVVPVVPVVPISDIDSDSDSQPVWTPIETLVAQSMGIDMTSLAEMAAVDKAIADLTARIAELTAERAEFAARRQQIGVNFADFQNRVRIMEAAMNGDFGVKATAKTVRRAASSDGTGTSRNRAKEDWSFWVDDRPTKVGQRQPSDLWSVKKVTADQMEAAWSATHGHGIFSEGHQAAGEAGEQVQVVNKDGKAITFRIAYTPAK
jgi:hypothetical protein